MNIYKLNAVCTCPADGLPDSYSVTIECRRMLWTNVIGEAVKSLSSKKMPQEEFTFQLHRILQAKVITVGIHPSFTGQEFCSDIEIVCTSGEP